jgi:cytochrome c biogenesis protein CcmG/thiol:disulfide interchange protein DsbE
MKALLAFLGLILTLNIVAADAPRPEDSKYRSELDAMEGKAAPALQLDNWINGKAVQLSELKGKIVVLDFWATWCGPCIASIPHNNELSQKYADKGVVFIGVCAKNGAEKMAETVTKHQIKYPVAADSEGKTVAAFKANSYPDYYIIDRKGILRWADFVNDDVEKAIQILVAEE